MKRTQRRALEGAALFAGVAVAVAWLSGGCEERVAPGEATLPGEPLEGATWVPVESVLGPTVEWASGQVASARQTAISSRVLARIEDIRVRAGSSVSEGDVLVRLDARDLQARVREAEEALRESEARLDLAGRESDRTRELFRSGVAPQRRMDEASAKLRAAEAEVAGRKEALEETRAAASFAEIRSPVAGRVVDRLAEPGDTAVPGRPLLRVYDPALLRVEAPVRESLAVALRVGDTLQVEVPALAQRLDGPVDEIVPFAEPGARTLLVKVRLPRSGARLFAGMFARVAVPAGERRLLLVPATAIERVGQLEFATVAGEQGGTERRLVTTGSETSDGRVEVLSGLDAGERVRVPEAAPSPTAAPERPEAAAAAVARLRAELSRALREALAEGPEAAIDACRVEAPRLAAELSIQGLRVGRTSHRLRNPDNAPEDWMLPLLELYRAAEPEPGSFRVVDLGPQGTGYVEPIYLQPLCATCHGENVPPKLLDHIRALYPQDRAVGFRVGELRGLFWATLENASG